MWNLNKKVIFYHSYSFLHYSDMICLFMLKFIVTPNICVIVVTRRYNDRFQNELHLYSA